MHTHACTVNQFVTYMVASDFFRDALAGYDVAGKRGEIRFEKWELHFAGLAGPRREEENLCANPYRHAESAVDFFSFVEKRA